MHQLVSMGTLTIVIFSEPVGHVDRLLDLDYCLYITRRMGDLKGLNPQEPVRHDQLVSMETLTIIYVSEPVGLSNE